MSRRLRLVLQSVLTLGVVGALVIAVDPSVLYASFRTARWTWVAVAVLLLPVNLFLDGWVWARLLDPVEGSFPPRTVATAVLSGMALGFWTPARLGEYAGRALSFPDADSWTLSVAVFVQRMADMGVGISVGLALLLTAIGTSLLPASPPWLLAAAIGVGGTGLLGVGVLAPARLHRWASLLDRWDLGVSRRTVFLTRLGRRHRAEVIGGSLVRYLVFTGQFACLGLAFAPSASLTLLGGAVGLTFYAKYLLPSLTMLDLGIREGSAVFFFQLVGLDAAAGFNAALCLFAINVLLPAVLGVPFVPQLAGSTEFSSILPSS